jgi:hypothetical protein
MTNENQIILIDLIDWCLTSTLSSISLGITKSIGEIPIINSKLDDREQHSRKSCVRISGVPESVGENTADIVCEIAKKLLFLVRS